MGSNAWKPARTAPLKLVRVKLGSGLEVNAVPHFLFTDGPFTVWVGNKREHVWPTHWKEIEE